MADDEKLAQVFRNWDRDGNGSISRDELERTLCAIGMEAAQCAQIVALADHRGDGVIDYAEFCAWVFKAKEAPNGVAGDMEFHITEVYKIPGVGILLQGSVRKGVLVPENSVAFLQFHGEPEPCRAMVTVIQQNHKKMTSAKVGDAVGVGLKMAQGCKAPQAGDVMIYHGPAIRAIREVSQLPALSDQITLYSSAAAGNIDQVKELLEKGGDVNAPREDSWAPGVKRSVPLHYAVQGGHAEVVKILLTAKANPNARDESSGGDTPLNFAQNDEMATLLKQAGGLK